MTELLHHTLPPVLNEFESTASTGVRIERLSEVEFEILSQLLRYSEEPLSRGALKRTAGYDDESLADRKLDALLSKLIKKTNVLWPSFAVVRFVPPDGYIYSEQPPRKKPAA